jgi:hypothetical protein
MRGCSTYILGVMTRGKMIFVKEREESSVDIHGLLDTVLAGLESGFKEQCPFSRERRCRSDDGSPVRSALTALD